MLPHSIFDAIIKLETIYLALKRNKLQNAIISPEYSFDSGTVSDRSRSKYVG